MNLDTHATGKFRHKFELENESGNGGGGPMREIRDTYTLERNFATQRQTPTRPNEIKAFIQMLSHDNVS